jgi:hypothetical protein
MKSVAISVLSVFAGFVFANAPPWCLLDDFLREPEESVEIFLMIGGTKAVTIGVVEDDPAPATNGFPVFWGSGAGRHQRIAESPNTSTSPAAIAPIKYCRRYRPADTGRAGN